MEDLDREESILEVAKEYLENSIQWQQAELSDNWEDAYAYYKAEAPAPSSAYTSTSVSTDVADTIEWVLPSILKPLVESPDVVRFDPVNPEDQDQADAESDYVHHTFMKKCNGFVKLYVHIKDALMLKNAVFRTYWAHDIKNTRETYQNLTEPELADLLSPTDGSEVMVLSSTSRMVPVTDVQTAAPVEPEPAQPTPGQPPAPPALPPPITLYDVEVRRICKTGKPVVENCKPENFYVHAQHPSIDLDDARWCAYKVVLTRGELIALGVEPALIAEIPEAEDQSDSRVQRARDDVELSASTEDDWVEYEVYHCYLVYDSDGDGYDEQLELLLGGSDGDVLLRVSEVPQNPFSASTPFIAGHKFYGYSLYDKLKAITDQKTAVLRMLEDNLDLANNPIKKVVKGMATLDDLLLRQTGGLWRVESLDAVAEVPVTPINQQGEQLLGYYDKQRSERSGMDPNAQAITNVMPEESMNTAVERVLTMKEELVGLMIRVFAETGVRSMFVKLRNLMLMHNPREEIAQLRNKWVTINPANWFERSNTTVVVGLGTGDRYRKQGALMNMLGIQKELAMGGFLGPLVSAERINYTISELVRVTGLGDPDDYVLDPAMLEKEDPSQLSPRAREAMRAYQMQQQQAQTAQQQEMAAQQAQIQAAQQLAQLQMEIEQLKAQTDLQKAQLQEQSKDRDRLAEMQQFMEENRRLWAELKAKYDVQSSKSQADIARTLFQGGIQQEIARENKSEKGESE